MELKKLLSTDDIVVDDAAVISIDSKGVDIKVRQGAQVPPTCLPFFSFSFYPKQTGDLKTHFSGAVQHPEGVI